jgi:hypothetical protein
MEKRDELMNTVGNQDGTPMEIGLVKETPSDTVIQTVNNTTAITMLQHK